MHSAFLLALLGMIQSTSDGAACLAKSAGANKLEVLSKYPHFLVGTVAAFNLPIFYTATVCFVGGTSDSVRLAGAYESQWYPVDLSPGGCSTVSGHTIYVYSMTYNSTASIEFCINSVRPDGKEDDQ
jgi:hypothetical protein